MRRPDWVLILSCLCAHPLAGCGADDSPAPDAAPPDAAADAAVDAAPDTGVDAGACRGQVLFTGSYEDWDGNSAGPNNTLGTVVAQADDVQNSTTINAPNGRVVLCLPADETSLVTFTNDDYLPLRYTFEPASAATAFDIRGLTPARADELFVELGLTRDPLLAQVIVAVRMETDNPEAVGAAVTGARVALGNAAAGAFTPDEGGVYGAGDTLAGGAFVLFANTEPVSETTTVTVTPPDGVACTGPDLVSLTAGELAVTTFACAAREPRAGGRLGP
jgi:hypothetical protein